MKRNLFEGGLLVVVILLLVLGNVRAAFIVALAIPLSMLFAVTMMVRFGIAGSLMSLGAIDFGLIDGSVVMVENTVRRLSSGGQDADLLDTIREGCAEVARPIIFGVGTFRVAHSLDGMARMNATQNNLVWRVFHKSSQGGDA